MNNKLTNANFSAMFVAAVLGSVVVAPAYAGKTLEAIKARGFG